MSTHLSYIQVYTHTQVVRVCEYRSRCVRDTHELLGILLLSPISAQEHCDYRCSQAVCLVLPESWGFELGFLHLHSKCFYPPSHPLVPDYKQTVNRLRTFISYSLSTSSKPLFITVPSILKIHLLSVCVCGVHPVTLSGSQAEFRGNFWESALTFYL